MNPISGGFVVPMGTSKSPEMRFVGCREGFQKSISKCRNKGWVWRNNFRLARAQKLFRHPPGDFGVHMGTTKPPAIGSIHRSPGRFSKRPKKKKSVSNYDTCFELCPTPSTRFCYRKEHDKSDPGSMRCAPNTYSYTSPRSKKTY